MWAVCGCVQTIRYTGDGQITDTTSREAVVRVPEYSINLGTFPLNDNFQREFNLGALNLFSRTAISVVVRFNDRSSWHSYGKSGAELAQFYSDRGCRNLDILNSRVAYQVIDEPGNQIMKSDKLLKDCLWSQSQMGGGTNRISVVDANCSPVEIPPADKLKLKFSYEGDTNLSYNAELLVICHSK